MNKKVILYTDELNPPYEISTDNPAVVAIVEMAAKHEALLTRHDWANDILYDLSETLEKFNDSKFKITESITELMTDLLGGVRGYLESEKQHE